MSDRSRRPVKTWMVGREMDNWKLEMYDVSRRAQKGEVAFGWFGCRMRWLVELYICRGKLDPLPNSENSEISSNCFGLDLLQPR